MSDWVFDPTVTLGLLVLLGCYLLGVRAARRRDGWPWWRTLCFIALGLGSVALCTMSPLAGQNHRHLWAIAAQLTLLISISPVGIALGDPVGLVRAGASERGVRRLDAVLAGPVLRVLTFPVVSAILATATLMVVFLGPLLGAAVRHDAVLDLVYLLVLVVGCLAALPLLGAEILPAWCTEPLKLVFAFVDGLVDAIPGIVVMTTSTKLAGGYFAGTASDRNWDAHVAGSLMLALSEVVALPLFFLLFFRWAASEIRRPPEDPDEPLFSKPWWEEDAGHADRSNSSE